MKEQYKRNIWQATHCSINFLTLYIAFNTTQNIESQALEDDGLGKLGFWSIAVLYLSLGISSLFSSIMVRKLGEIKCMAIGGLLNTPWILAFALCGMRRENPDNDAFYLQPNFITAIIILLSIINGFGQAIQWVGQGKYMSDCATEDTKGFFFSYFWAFYMASNIFGNLIAAYCLRSMNQSMLFVVMGIISLLSTISSLFLRKPNIMHPQKPHQTQEQQQKAVNPFVIDDSPPPIKSDDIQIQDETNTSKKDIEIQQEDREFNQEETFREQVRSLIFMILSKRMRRFLPQLFWTGISIAFYSSCLTPMITDTLTNQDNNQKLEKSMIAMVIFGIGEVCGCIVIGQVIDSQGSKFTSVINVIIIVIMTIVTLAFIGINQFNLLAFLMTFLWGFQDSTVNTHCFEVCGFEFENNSQPYSIFNLFQAMGVFIFQIIESFLDTRIKYIVYTSFIGMMGIYTCGLTFFFEYSNKKDQEQLPREIQMHELRSSKVDFRINNSIIRTEENNPAPQV